MSLPANTAVPAPQPGRPPRTRLRFWLLLALTLLTSLLLYPRPWQALVRAVLVRQAARQGYHLSIGRIVGGPFETLQLYDLRLYPGGRAVEVADAGTDLRVVHAQLTFAWTIPYLQRAAPSWIERLTLAGVSGRVDLSDTLAVTGRSARPARPGGPAKWFDHLGARWTPSNFFVQADDCTLQRGRYRLRARGLQMTGERDATGLLLVHAADIAGPSFQNTFLKRRGTTFWQGDRLTVADVDFGAGLRLAGATLDGSGLKNHRLNWEGTLASQGGEVRGQGTVDFSRPRLALEVAGSLRQMSVSAIARLVGLAGPSGGVVEQGNFSFRGDPEDWLSAEMWLVARATNFRWNQRACQSLDLQAVVLHRRVQVNRLELRQNLNRVSLKGEWPLPSVQSADRAALPFDAGFTCNVDARLDDLHALAQLVGPRMPDATGRMSINGMVGAMPGQPGIKGYLNVEGSRLTWRGAPLDYLRSTLLFRGEELQVADLQVTHGSDYLSGKGTARLVGKAGYQGEFRVAVQDPTTYLAALAGVFDLGKSGLPVSEIAGPVALNGFFDGPGNSGGTAVQMFGLPDALSNVAVSVENAGWETVWPGLTLWPAIPLPVAVSMYLN